MNTLSFTQSEHTRVESLHFIQNSMPANVWDKNISVINQFKKQTINHPLFNHPILARLHQGQLTLTHLKLIHINYFTAIVKNFTDALSMAIYQANALEQHQSIHQEKRIASKIYARYLLSLNLIDELGFNTHDLAQSSPSKSHLVYFLKLMQTLHLDPLDQKETEIEALSLTQFIQNHMHSYADLLLILACTELQVIKFSQALRQNISIYNSEFTEGYYACHGIAQKNNLGLANDDNHEDDIWLLFTQCYTPENESHFQRIHTEYLELWDNFWNKINQLTT